MLYVVGLDAVAEGRRENPHKKCTTKPDRECRSVRLAGPQCDESSRPLEVETQGRIPLGPLGVNRLQSLARLRYMTCTDFGIDTDVVESAGEDGYDNGTCAPAGGGRAAVVMTLPRGDSANNQPHDQQD